MSEKKGLSSTAYGGIKGDDYVPFVPLSQALPELTLLTILAGCFFAVLFAAANTYLGLKIGMTIAAGIPAAILATTFYKGVLKKNNILEINMVQSMAAMGESLAGGLIFIIPAVLIIGMQLPLTLIITVGLLGGLLGIIFVVPLRRYLIVEEHGNLIYPEGMATSEVLVSSSEGGRGFITMMTGVGIGGVYKFLTEGFGIFNYEAEWTIKPMQSTIFGIDVMASLLGVGFIVGLEIAMYMFAGAVLAYFGIIPLIKFFGAGAASAIFPGTEAISTMSAGAIRGAYIKYIGAGAVAAGGFISIAKAMPIIVKSFKAAMAGLGGGEQTQKRTEKDIPMTWVLIGSVFVFVLAWVLPNIKAGVIGSIMIIICAFFFSVVSARLVGMIGTSNNPISGMTIATLLVITATLKATGNIGDKGMLAALLCSAIVCAAIAVAGGTAQSLKATYIIGGTPKYVEIAMYIAVIASTAVIGAVILMLNKQYGIGGDKVAAPQATMMAMLVKGVMNAQLPWILIAIGAVIGIMCELLKVPVLPFALGLYLPIHLSAGVLVGGIIRSIVEKKYKNEDSVLKEKIEKGILLSSGLVAGDALFGILIAIFAMTGTDIFFGPKIIPAFISANPWFTAIVGLLFALWMYFFVTGKEKKKV
jgi:putative OPT family oligopeptide transporter